MSVYKKFIMAMENAFKDLNIVDTDVVSIDDTIPLDSKNIKVNAGNFIYKNKHIQFIIVEHEEFSSITISLPARIKIKENTSNIDLYKKINMVNSNLISMKFIVDNIKDGFLYTSINSELILNNQSADFSYIVFILPLLISAPNELINYMYEDK